MAYLGLILGTPEVRDLSPPRDPRRATALTLAEAEARLERARDTEEQFLLETQEGKYTDGLLRDVRLVITEEWNSVKDVSPEVERILLAWSGHVPYKKTTKILRRWDTPEGRMRTLHRYRAAAEVARKKALSDWIEISTLAS